MTFDDAVAHVAAQQDPRITEVKQSFVPTVAELRQLKGTFPKAKMLGRLATIQRRWQRALGVGVYDAEIVRQLEELNGGRGLSPGLIVATEQQIESGIVRMERFGAADLPHRNTWICWFSEPQKVRDNISRTEALLDQLEEAVKDGGRVQQRIEQKAAQHGTAPLTTPPRGPVTTVTVDSTFKL